MASSENPPKYIGGHAPDTVRSAWWVDVQADELAVGVEALAVSSVRSPAISSRVRWYRGRRRSCSPGMSDEMMLIVKRPCAIWSMVASWRASWGSHISPMRTASSRLICSVCVAMAAANAVESMPSAYPDGSSTLS